MMDHLTRHLEEYEETGDPESLIAALITCRESDPSAAGILRLKAKRRTSGTFTGRMPFGVTGATAFPNAKPIKQQRTTYRGPSMKAPTRPCGKAGGE